MYAFSLLWATWAVRSIVRSSVSPQAEVAVAPANHAVAVAPANATGVKAVLGATVHAVHARCGELTTTGVLEDLCAALTAADEDTQLDLVEYALLAATAADGPADAWMDRLRSDEGVAAAQALLGDGVAPEGLKAFYAAFDAVRKGRLKDPKLVQAAVSLAGAHAPPLGPAIALLVNFGIEYFTGALEEDSAQQLREIEALVARTVDRALLAQQLKDATGHMAAALRQLRYHRALGSAPHFTAVAEHALFMYKDKLVPPERGVAGSELLSLDLRCQFAPVLSDYLQTHLLVLGEMPGPRTVHAQKARELALLVLPQLVLCALRGPLPGTPVLPAARHPLLAAPPGDGPVRGWLALADARPLKAPAVDFAGRRAEEAVVEWYAGPPGSPVSPERANGTLACPEGSFVQRVWLARGWGGWGRYALEEAVCARSEHVVLVPQTRFATRGEELCDAGLLADGGGWETVTLMVGLTVEDGGVVQSVCQLAYGLGPAGPRPEPVRLADPGWDDPVAAGAGVWQVEVQGRLLLTASDQGLALFEARPGAPAAGTTLTNKPTKAIALGGGYAFAAASSAGRSLRTRVTMWGLRSHAEVRVFHTPLASEDPQALKNAHVAAVLAAQGTLITGMDGGLILLWSVERAEVQMQLSGHLQPVRGLAISGGNLFSGSQDGSCRMWNLRSGDALRVFGRATPAPNGKGHVSVRQVAALGGRLFAATSEGLKVWSMDGSVRLLEPGFVTSLCLGSGAVLASVAKQGLEAWSAEGALLRTVPHLAPSALGADEHGVAMGLREGVRVVPHRILELQGLEPARRVPPPSVRTQHALA